MRVLILGITGMLGHVLWQDFQKEFEVFGTVRESRGEQGRIIEGVNAASGEGIDLAFKEAKPEIVINCIGIIKQLKEAHDPIISITVNSLFPHILARKCREADCRLIHISTDCVFSGRKGNYSEEDTPDAEDLYGRTKLLGEVNRPGCLTIRTSIFGRDFLKQSALLEWFLSNGGGKVRGYKNALYTGFTTQALARIVGDLITDYPQLSGLYQIASQPISKYELLVKLRQAMRLDIEIEPYDDPPCDRSLSAARFVAATGYRLPTWDEMLAELAADPTPYDEWRQHYAAA